MRILVIHPMMSPKGGGERLCCETILAASKHGHEVALVTEEFDVSKLEEFFGYSELFAKVKLLTYSIRSKGRVNLYEDLIRRVKRQQKVLPPVSEYDLVFSTQDPGYIPDARKHVLQWGYFPNPLPSGIYGWPVRQHYGEKIKRISLVLAISRYSKHHLDSAWRIPSRVIYPSCNMVQVQQNIENTVVTAARGVPEKRLELFWKVATQCPKYEFELLLTIDPRFVDYANKIREAAPKNGKVIVNPTKELYHQSLAKSRVYLHLMRGEHFGITIVEAMSAGCIPIVHDSGGPKEIVENSGFIWRNENEIPALIESAERTHESLSSLARERAQMFSREKFDEALSEVLVGIA